MVRGEDAEGAGGGGRGERGPLQGPGAHGAALVVLGALAADALAAAERAGVEVQQHRLPAGDGRDRPAQAVSGAAHRKEGAFFDRGGDGSAGRGGARAVAGGGGGRQGPGRAHPVRAVRAGQPAGRAAPAGDLGGGGEPVAQPGGRSAAGLRGQPGRALRRDPPAAGPGEFIAALQKRLREALDRFEQRAGGGHHGRGGDREEARRAVDQGLAAAASRRSRRT